MNLKGGYEMKRATLFVRCLVYVLIIQISLPFTVFAGTVGQFAEVKGDVSLKRAAETFAAKVQEGIQLKDVISTGQKSRAKLSLVDDSLLSLGQNSKLEISEFLFDQGKRSSILSLQAGKLYANVKKISEPERKFEVRTPTAIAGARGTAWISVVEETANPSGPKSTFYALDVPIDVANPRFPDKAVTVNPGESSEVAENSPPTRPKPFAIPIVMELLDELGVSSTALGVGVSGAAGAGAAAGAAGAAGVQRVLRHGEMVRCAGLALRGPLAMMTA